MAAAVEGKASTTTNVLVGLGLVVALVLGVAYTSPNRSALGRSAREREAVELGLGAVQKRLADIQAGSASLQEQINLAERTDDYLTVLDAGGADGEMRLQAASAFEEVARGLGLDQRGLDPQVQTPANVPGTLRAMALTVDVVGDAAALDRLLDGLHQKGLLVTIASVAVSAQDPTVAQDAPEYLSPGGPRLMRVSFYIWYSILPRLLLPG